MSNDFQVPACHVVVNGLKAEFHVIHHQTKLKQHPLDAGIDIFGSAIDRDVDYWQDYDLGTHGHEIYVSTLVHIVVPPGTVGLLVERSSSIRTLAGGRVIAGVIDASYTGEIMVRVLATDTQVETVKKAIGEAIKERIALAQLLVQPVYVAVPRVAKLPESARGSKGFGSTSGLSQGQ